MYIKQEVLEYAFMQPESLRLSDKFTLKREFLGEINLPSGQIVGNDPLALFEILPFTHRAKPGKYPVTLFVLNIHSNGDNRVALAKVSFSENPAVRWEMAATEGQNTKALGNDEFYGYSVDSGIGGFMSSETAQTMDRLDTEDPKEYERIMLREVMEQLEDSYVHTYSTLNYTFGDSGLNAAMFSSGFGDGVYPSYFGFGADDEICCLVTDFGLLSDLDALAESIENLPLDD